MLNSNHLIGFGAGQQTVQTFVSAGAGTAIGNLTANGNLAASFDGTTNQAVASCSSIVSGDRTNGFIGKDWGVGVTKTISGFVAYGPNNQGFNQINPGTVTIELQGSTDNFSSSTVDLGNVTVPSGEGSSQVGTKLSGLNTSTAYRYHRLKITSASGSTSTDNKSCAECQFYEEI